jgi:transcriptional regulator with XRE-family HTH domain
MSKKENTYDRIKRLADAKGLSLLEVCEAAGVDRSTVERWKGRETKTVTVIQSLEAAIDRLPAKTTAKNEPTKN